MRQRNVDLNNWTWPFQRWSSRLDPEWSCPHGVGHGFGVHGCEGCCGDKSFMKYAAPQMKYTILNVFKADNFEKMRLIKKYKLEKVSEKEGEKIIKENNKKERKARQ